VIQEPHYLQSTNNYKFCGFLFEDRRDQKSRALIEKEAFEFYLHGKDIPDFVYRQVHHLLCWAELLNPEAPGLIQSYHSYSDVGGFDRTTAAAWLISHWYEHALNICECLGGEPSHFRWAFIDTILFLQS